jgi:hypothetical protein
MQPLLTQVKRSVGGMHQLCRWMKIKEASSYRLN